MPHNERISLMSALNSMIARPLIFSMTVHLKEFFSNSVSPVFTFFRGFIRHSYNFCFLTCRKTNISTFPPVFLLADNRAGMTFVLFKMSTSPFLKYPAMELNFSKCLFPLDLSKTMRLDPSRFFAGFCAMSSPGRSKSKRDDLTGFSANSLKLRA